MDTGRNRDAQLPDQRVRGRRREVSPDCHGPVASTCQERRGYRLRQQGETNKHLLSFPLPLLSAQNSDIPVSCSDLWICRFERILQGQTGERCSLIWPVPTRTHA